MTVTLDRSIDDAAATPAVPLQDKFAALRAALQSDLIDRDDEIDALLWALLSRTHLFLLSEPGTGKSWALDRTCAYISGIRVFKTELHRQMTTADLFGPLRLSALKQDRYEYNVAGGLADCDVARLGELWKGNQSTQQAMLSALNERVFANGNDLMRIPLSTVLCDSNELPQGEGLGAVWDRLLQRVVVSPLSDGAALLRLLKLNPDPNPQPVMSWTDVQAAQQEAAMLPVTDDAQVALIDIHQRLAREGIRPSNRRFRQVQVLAQAAAWLDGATEAGPEHLEPCVNAFWEAPEQISAVCKSVIEVSSPAQAEVLEVSDAVGELVEQFNDAMKIADAKERYEPLLGIQRRLARARKDIDKLRGRAAGRSLRLVDKVDRELEALKEQVVTQGFGI